MPKAGVEKLVSLMKSFQAKQSSWGFLLTDKKTGQQQLKQPSGFLLTN
jgi:hypothetical protein